MRVIGIVVAIEQYVNRRLYTIDDSSGRNILAVVIPPAPAKPKNESTAGEQRTSTDAKPADAQGLDPYADVDVGTVVDVKGGVSAFRNERQINVDKMAIVKSTSQEVVLWEKRERFRREILDVPWLLREKDVRRCRREAERSEAEAEQKKAKKQRRANELKHGNAKPAARASKSKSLRDDSAAKRIESIIREGASTGKYNVLGL